MPRYPSRFVLDIDPDLVDFVTPLEDSLVKDARAYMRAKDRKLDQAAAMAVHPAGTRVRHAVFGEGEIMSYDPDRNAYEIQFDAIETTRTVAARVKMDVL
jgi:DNA helicase-2/ATP-dependent DNA helicase PcrA